MAEAYMERDVKMFLRDRGRRALFEPRLRMIEVLVEALPAIHPEHVAGIDPKGPNADCRLPTGQRVPCDGRRRSVRSLRVRVGRDSRMDDSTGPKSLYKSGLSDLRGAA